MKTTSHTTTADSVDFLKTTYAGYVRQNPRYSIRAFAKKLGLSPGGLSQILNHKKNLSPQRAYEIAKKLDLSFEETNYFLSLVQIDAAKNLSFKSDLIERLSEQFPKWAAPRDLSIDQFRLISEWYGLAVLEFIGANKTIDSAQKVATYFGITRAEAQSALDRLEKLELIERTPAGFFRKVIEPLSIESEIPAEALRNYYKNLLGPISESITAQTPKEKIIGTQVMAFDVSQLDEVRRLTDQFLSSLERLAMKGKRRTHVYQAFFNFFRLNKARGSARPTGLSDTIPTREGEKS